MAITAEYDRQADALYVRLGDGDRRRTLELDEATYVDVDDEGQAVGFEFLYPSMGVALATTARRFSLDKHLPEIIAAIGSSGAPIPPLTMTGGQFIASTSVTGYVVEGTVPAGRWINEAVSVASPHAQDPVLAGTN